MTQSNPLSRSVRWRAALERGGLQIRFHDLRHTCITKLAESQAGEHHAHGHRGSRHKMIEHNSHIRVEAKRAALDRHRQRAVVTGGS